ncbi:hypothetical protein GGR92_001032 [Spirosoma lacussanchae]|uniref:hypothetical protein n=1 Tax=Spirosoma lacussanchae TaxID=1884249 RepID=UPI00110901E8|nr:hypothetical protein [Spirosoma lacussanchae]
MLRTCITSVLLGIGLITAGTAQAQTLTENTTWLKKELNELVDSSDAKPVFDFKDCLMTMNVNTKEEGIRVKVDMNWPLKEIRKVSYKAASNGNYTLVLDVPANQVKGKVKVGIFSKTLREKGDGGHTSLDLNTRDEKRIQAIQQRFETSIRQCQRGS